MDAQTTNNDLFQQGFNEGYMLAKNLPELSIKLAQIKGEGERLQGMQAGINEHKLEKVRSIMPSRLASRTVRKDKGKDKDFEKG